MAAVDKAPKGHVEKYGLVSFDKWVEGHRTVAFLVIWRDTILTERYFKGYDAGHLHPSFSHGQVGGQYARWLRYCLGVYPRCATAEHRLRSRNEEERLEPCHH